MDRWTLLAAMISLVLWQDPVSGSAALPETTVEVWGEASGGPELSPARLRRLALEDARVRAVEAASGVRVEAAGLYRGGLEGARFVHTSAHGFVVSEEVEQWRAEVLQESPAAFPDLRVTVRLRATVVVPPRRPGAELTANLNRESFRTGELAELTVASTEPLWVCLFNLSPDDRATVLLPNRTQGPQAVAPGRALVFPPRDGGSVLQIEAGEAPGAEAFLVVGFRRQVDVGGLLEPEQAYGVAELYRRLSALPFGEAAVALVPYSVEGGGR